MTPGAVECDRCGATWNKRPRPPSAERPLGADQRIHTSASYRYCSGCGTLAEHGTEYCGECGRRLVRVDTPSTQIGALKRTQTIASGPGPRPGDTPTSAPTGRITQPSAPNGRAFSNKSRSWKPIVGIVAAIAFVAALVILVTPQIRHDLFGRGATSDTDVGLSCSQNPACHETNTSVSSGPSGSPSSYQLQQAYQSGLTYGQHFPATFNPDGLSSYCNGASVARYTNPELRAQFLDGCGAGYGG